MIFLKVLAIIVLMAGGVLCFTVGFALLNIWWVMGGVSCLGASLYLHMKR